MQGFLDGYNTMDALVSVVFAILVIDFVRLTGATSRDVITKTVMEVGAIAGSITRHCVYIHCEHPALQA